MIPKPRRDGLFPRPSTCGLCVCAIITNTNTTRGRVGGTGVRPECINAAGARLTVTRAWLTRVTESKICRTVLRPSECTTFAPIVSFHTTTFTGALVMRSNTCGYKLRYNRLAVAAAVRSTHRFVNFN